MTHHDASSARCEVLTFKDGVLSAVAHDLRLRVERITVEIDDETEAIVARVQAGSLRVDCAMKDGRPAPGTLSAKQKREIEDNIQRKVLHVSRHPEIVFRSRQVTGEGDERRIEGTLSLHGVERPLDMVARRHGGSWQAEVELLQPDFGITPFSAMLGTLRIKPRVRVLVSVPGRARRR